jgi:very-short-patch-repair endonuclease
MLGLVGGRLSVVRPDIPTELKRGPFFVVDAAQVGLEWRDLQTRSWKRLSHGQYSWSGLSYDTLMTLRAVAARIPATYAFSGPTAAWLLGVDMPPCSPVEVTVDRDAPVRARAGIRLRRARLPETDVTPRRGFRSTSALRTACDLGSRRDLIEAVVALDSLLHARLVELAQLQSYVQGHRGAPGIRRLRRATGLADPRSESPMETRLRVHLIQAHLPRPSVQVDLHDATGRLLGRADLYYPDRRLVIEYDGESHKERIAQDLRRQNALVNAGYHLLRFTAGDLAHGSAAAQVRRARSRLKDLSR